jgi:flavin-dependent dehydrogenase
MRGREEYTVDQILYRRAKAAGAEFRFSEKIDPTDADIAAIGPPRDRFNMLGAGHTFAAKSSSLRRDTAFALFDNDVAPAGYLTITPGLDFHSIYSVSWKELDFETLLERTERAFKLPWIREIMGESRLVSKIHGRAYFAQDPIATAVRNGTLFAGEAGGFQDAVAGFGFRYAVITGFLAARAILDGQDYRELLKAVFADEFHLAHAFRERLSRMTNDDYDRMVAELGPEITLHEYARKRAPRGF